MKFTQSLSPDCHAVIPLVDQWCSGNARVCARPLILTPFSFDTGIYRVHVSEPRNIELAIV